jgi:hypothetical protein
MSSAESQKLRRERLAAALRQNLRRRKEQGRARRQDEADAPAPDKARPVGGPDDRT